MTRPGVVEFEVAWSPDERTDAPRLREGEGESMDIRSRGLGGSIGICKSCERRACGRGFVLSLDDWWIDLAMVRSEKVKVDAKS
jgi:hypothetical protein